MRVQRKVRMAVLAACVAAAGAGASSRAGTYTWLGTGYDWNTAANWVDQNNNQGVPGETDTAIIGGSIAHVTTDTTVNTLTFNDLGGLVLDANIQCSNLNTGTSGGFGLGQNGDYSLTIGSGSSSITTGFDSNVVINGSFTQSAASMGLAAHLDVNGTLVFNPGTSFSGGYLSTMTVDGVVRLADASGVLSSSLTTDGNATVSAGGVLAVGAGATAYFGGAVVNSGLMSVGTGGLLRFGGSGTCSTSGLIEVGSGGTLEFNSLSSSTVNGTVAAGTGGTVTFNYGCDLGGTITAAAHANVTFYGTLTSDGGKLMGTSPASGTFTMPAVTNLSGNLEVSNTTLINNNGTITGSGTLTLSNSTAYFDPVVINAPFCVGAASGFHFIGGAILGDGGIAVYFQNQGTTYLEGGNLFLLNGSEFENIGGHLYLPVDNGYSIADEVNGAGQIHHITGTITNQANTTFAINYKAETGATLEVLAGTLALTKTGYTSGKFDVSAGAAVAINMTGSQFVIGPLARFDGAGRTVINGLARISEESTGDDAAATVNGSLVLSATGVLAAGVLNGVYGSLSINVGGVMDVQGGTLSGAHLATIRNTSGGVGTLLISGSPTLTGNAVIQNYGRFEVGTGVTLSLAAGGGATLATGGYESTAGGALVVNGTLTFTNTAVTFPPTGATRQTVDVGIDLRSLTIGTAGVLDVNDHDLIVHYAAGNGATTLAAITSEILSGKITSSALASDQSLGYVDNAALTTPYTSFDGIPLADSNEVLVKYTYTADANLDGKVTFADYQMMMSGWGLPSTTWATGDFNGDGVTNFSDFQLFMSNNGKGVGSPLAPVGAGVPEPASLGLLALGALGLLARKR